MTRLSLPRVMKRHQESIHQQSVGLSSEVCSKHFYRKDVLTEHMKTHQPKVPKAPPSTEPEESVHDLHDDSRACPPDSAVSLGKEPPPKKHRETRHVCSVCAKSFSSKKILKRHQDCAHRQSAGFSSQVCSQHYSQPGNRF